MEEQEQPPTLSGLPEDRVEVIMELVDALGLEIG